MQAQQMSQTGETIGAKLRALTPKQRRFVLFYQETDNATEAAKRAGYSAKVAYRQGCDNLKLPHIQAALDKERLKLAEKHDITMDWLKDKLINVYDLAIAGQPGLDRYGKETGTVIRQLAVAKGALDTLGKQYGLLVERHAHLHKSLDDMSEADLRLELAKGNEQLGALDVVVEHDTVDSE